MIYADAVLNVSPVASGPTIRLQETTFAVYGALFFQVLTGTEYINYELWTDSGRTARVGIATVTVLDTSQAEPVFVPVTLKGSGVTLSGVTVNIK